MKRALEDNYNPQPTKKQKIFNNNSVKTHKTLSINIDNISSEKKIYTCYTHNHDQIICNMYDCIGIKSCGDNRETDLLSVSGIRVREPQYGYPDNCFMSYIK